MALGSLSTAVLVREVARREKAAGKLLARHEKLAKETAAIEAELAELGVSPGRTAVWRRVLT